MNIKNKVLYNEIRTLSGYSLDLETLCLRVSGDDSSKFLQGQLSNDINLIDDNNYQISSYSTNQGKVISINRIFIDKSKFLWKEKDPEVIRNFQSCFNKFKGEDLISVTRNGLTLSTFRKVY